MLITEFFHRIGAPNVRAGAAESEIAATEARLGGTLPEGLRRWFREANGFEGNCQPEAGYWRFRSLEGLCSVAEHFPLAAELAVEHDGQPSRRAGGSDYVIVCDALIYAPFYAVNIRPQSPRYSEVIMGMEELASTPFFVADTFEEFADRLFAGSDDYWLYPEATAMRSDQG